MGTRVGLRDVRQGAAPARLRLLAPVRYLGIRHREKTRYDVVLPLIVAVLLWFGFVHLHPRPALFGEGGVLKIARDLLIMAVPFMIAALATAAMGAPGGHFDRRVLGAELILDGRALSLRQFVCYLLGYLCFLGMSTLIIVVAAEVVHTPFVALLEAYPRLIDIAASALIFLVCLLFSALTITVFWAIYFLTDIVSRESTS